MDEELSLSKAKSPGYKAYQAQKQRERRRRKRKQSSIDNSSVESVEPSFSSEVTSSPDSVKKPKISFYKNGAAGVNISVPETPEPVHKVECHERKENPAPENHMGHMNKPCIVKPVISARKQLFQEGKTTPFDEIKNGPDWLKDFQRLSAKEDNLSLEDKDRVIKKLKKKNYELQESYSSVVKQNSVLTTTIASRISSTVQKSISPYAFSQGRASLDHVRKTVSVPHPDLGNIEVPNLDCTIQSKVPVRANDIILLGYNRADNQRVILKRHSSIFLAVSEYHALKQIGHCHGVPEVLGVHFKYNQAFVVTKPIPTECLWVSLEDLKCKDSFTLITELQWKNLVNGIWQILDQIYLLGYIHNNLRSSNIVVSVTESNELIPYLTGFSLFCHVEDALTLKGKHTKEFADTITHMHRDVYFGQCPPGFRNDMYCFGKMLLDLFWCAESNHCHNSDVWKSIDLLVDSCLKDDLKYIKYGDDFQTIMKKFME